MAALTPLKLTVSDKASARFAGKFRMQRTKQTVLNQHMLHPANKHRRKTCNKFHNDVIFIYLLKFKYIIFNFLSIASLHVTRYYQTI